MVDREEDDTVEYQIMNTWYFNQTRTLPLTGEEEIYIPHTFIVFMAMAALRENPNFLPLVGNEKFTTHHLHKYYIFSFSNSTNA